MKSTALGHQAHLLHSQNFFHLSAIQGASIGVSSILIGNQLANKLGAGTAVCSILIGNLLLWMIGMTIVSMATPERENAVQNAKRYLGLYGTLVIASVLFLAFIVWFAFQVHYFTDSLEKVSPIGINKSNLLKVGAGFGFLCSLLSMGGIRLIKWFAIGLLPFLFLYYFYAIITAHRIISFGSWGVSFWGVTTTILLLLPGTVNLPTFFRHSKSREDSYLGLILMMLITSFFEISSIWLDVNVDTFVSTALPSFFNTFTITIILFASLSCNLLNIYFASACLETFIPRFDNVKGYAIIGMLGTSVYTFIQITKPVQFLVDLTNAFIAILGVVLLISFLIKLIVKHRPRIFEKTINGTAWLVGCLASLAIQINSPDLGTKALLSGVSASILFYILVIFIEETFWAWKHLYPKNGQQ